MVYPSSPFTTQNSYPYDNAANMQPCSDPCACTLKVYGTGSIHVQPNKADIILGVLTENKQLKQAQDENTARMTDVITVLTELGIASEDIQTHSYHITPQYDYIDGQQVFRGYRVEHLLNITVRDMDRIGEIIDAAVENGANQVSSIQFSLENPSIYYQQALDEAIDDALVKAMTLSRKLNIDVSHVPVRIIEKSFESDIPSPVRFRAVEGATPIQPGTVEISARIEAFFDYWPLY